MSMLSAQCNKLRKLADGIESRYGYPTAVKALRDAADTIWQLRNDLQRANAENAKLRELAILLLYGATHDAEPAERLVWSQKVNVLARELGIEVD